ncbi:MAG: alternative ribosome rescue aminoacyl-tRNA hydrolase ArfB [Bacteroidota bacterium]
MSIPKSQDLTSELIFTTSRSSGPGGQNVNKVNSKVTLKFDVMRSSILSNDQKELIGKKLAHRLTKEGILVITSQDQRSQLKNKEEVLYKLDQLFIKTFTPRKIRTATKPTKAAKHARIKDKKQRSEKKQWRQKP